MSLKLLESTFMREKVLRVTYTNLSFETFILNLEERRREVGSLLQWQATASSEYVIFKTKAATK